MAAKLRKSKMDAIKAMERCFRNMELIDSQFLRGMGTIDVTDAIGMSIYRNIRTVCESALYLVCLLKADPNGTVPFPQMKDLKKRGDYVDASPEAKIAAQAICDLKKDFEEGPITPQMIRLLLEMVEVFLLWAWNELRAAEGNVPDFAGRFVEIKRNLMGKLTIGFERDHSSGRIYMRYVGDKDLDRMTDEEIDELYRPIKSNSRKSLASLFIYLILKEHTDEDHHYTIEEVRQRLAEDYELDIDRKTISRYVHGLANEDRTYIWDSKNKRDGVWYSEKVPEWMD